MEIKFSFTARSEPYHELFPETGPSYPMSLLSLAFPPKSQQHHELPSTSLGHKHDFDGSKQQPFAVAPQPSQSFKCADFITPTTASNKAIYKEKYSATTKNAEDTFQIVDHNPGGTKYKAMMKSHFTQQRPQRQNFANTKTQRRPNQRLI